ncbi:hypothetical protein IG193_03115 [Infirmifilum lucidum]|uniref:Uncharacterized protein n=1 Tax=Infirmifilum lucidum TaxID=2776706 RepID=A0A7L9FKX4_9CREN|nr:hypothetical protein [Infirmifilum lucidum]QOJ79465.1 hypothetical protein IG193_03115 [Infirmifilum lucidum]
MKRRAQIVVTAILLIALYVISVLLMVYHVHTIFLKMRSPVAREIVASVTGDFQRALAAMLAVATRAYFNYTRFSDLMERFSSLGMSYYNRHNFTVARMVAKSFLEYWRQAVTKAYAEYGIQISYSIERLDVSKYLNRSRAVYNLMKGYWYLPSSGSYTYAKLKINLTALGLYNWESDVFAGLTVRVYRTPVRYSLPSDTSPGNVSITINVLFDRGEYYGNLLAKGWVEIYYPERAGNVYTGRWLRAVIRDVRYDGMGNYTITFEPYVEELQDPVTGEQYIPVMVVVSDERGILVEASTYNYIGFRVQKNTPDTLYYYFKSSSTSSSISKPLETPFEVYTLELTSNLSMYWLGQKLPVQSVRLPPFPLMPMKQIRVNATRDGTLGSLTLIPVQYENWTVLNWHGLSIRLPVGLSDPQMDFFAGTRFNTTLVFQISFPGRDIRQQFVLLWWDDDLDANPVNFTTRIRYVGPDRDPRYKDVMHPLFDLEFLDMEHKVARGFEAITPSTNPCTPTFDPDYHLHYWGIAAINLRSPDGKTVYGPVNIHGFGTNIECGGQIWYLASYRPYGIWSIFYRYLRYGYPAPIRIFALLNTTLVANIYDLTKKGGITEGLLRSDYYHIITLVEITNGTNYLPMITYIYWNGDKEGYGYWAVQVSGVSQPNIPDWGTTFGYFAYLTYPGKYPENSTDGTPVASTQRQTFTGYYPGILISQWGSQSGKAIIFNKKALDYWYKRVYGQKATSSFMCGYIPLCSADFQIARWDQSVEINEGLTLNYQTVIFAYNLTGTGWLGRTGTDGWLNAYVYTPMFLEKYTPSVVPP